MALVAPGLSQSEYSYEAVAIPVFEPGDEQAYSEVTSTIRACKTCVWGLILYYKTGNPALIGKPVTPVADPYDMAVITLDATIQPTGIWGSLDGSTPAVPVEWRATMKNTGYTRLTSRDPITKTATRPFDIYVYKIKRIIARYRMTDPKDSALSDVWYNKELNAFWVLQDGQYKCEVRLEAQFLPENITPTCFMWEYRRKTSGGAWVYSPGSAEFLDDRAAVTRMVIHRPGSYRVRAKCRDHYKQVTVHAVQVTDVEWVQHTNPISGNPGTGLTGDPGGGKRIFPGRLVPGDNAENARKVRIEAHIEPPIKGVALWFKLLDVDDPSWDAGVVDGDKRGNDNRGAPGRGSPYWMWDRTDRDGVAEVTTRLPMQPGDNLVCGVAATRASGVKLRRDHSTYIKDGKRRLLGTKPSPIAAASPLLTIWRYAHIERDRMEPVIVKKNTRRAKISQVIPRTSSRTKVMFGGRISDPRGHSGRFRPGTMTELGPAGRVWDVTDNMFSSAVTTHAAGDEHRPTVGMQVELRDDDQNWGELPWPATAWLEKHFRHCYITPVYDLPAGEAPFEPNYDARSDSRDEIVPYYAYDAASLNNGSYWAVYLLTAYQYDYDEDADPGTEGLTLGIVDGIRGQGASVFHETIHETPKAERPDLRKYVPAHEIFHLWGALHEDGGFIKSAAHMHEDLSHQSVSRIRSTVLP